ncbi:MAG: AMP-binding protein [Panacagrimonas sp.]
MIRPMVWFHPRTYAASDPQRPALILADTGEILSYSELVERADRAARLFEAQGLSQGDTLAILMENHLRYPELCWAAKNSGIAYACIGSQSSIEDAAFIVEDSDARMLITSAALADLALAVARRCGPGLRLLITDGEREPFQCYESLLAQQQPTPLSGRRRGPSMLYSSGTTGRPKGVRTPLPDDGPEIPPRRFAMLQERYGLDPDTVMVCPGPFYHAAPGRFMMSVQRAGGTMVAFRSFDARATLAAIDRYRATHGLFVPTMFVRMLELPPEERASHPSGPSRCALHLGAPCPVAVKEKMIAWWGPVIEELYGGTEAIGHTLIGAEEWLRHKGSVGRPAPGCEIRIKGDDGHPVPTGTPGLIMLRNGNRFEYHKDPEKTRAAIGADGWGTLGDVGYIDDEGYLYLTDRQSHMIISGGVNIYPQESENLLLEHPAVADVAVIGVPHDVYGEEVKAVVQPYRYPLIEPESLARELIEFCRARLTHLKCPRSVDFVARLPRSEAGKLIKHLVKAPYWVGHNGRVI